MKPQQKTSLKNTFETVLVVKFTKTSSNFAWKTKCFVIYNYANFSLWQFNKIAKYYLFIYKMYYDY